MYAILIASLIFRMCILLLISLIPISTFDTLWLWLLFTDFIVFKKNEDKSHNDHLGMSK